jgi:hypothetical protein
MTFASVMTFATALSLISAASFALAMAWLSREARFADKPAPFRAKTRTSESVTESC